MCVVYEDLTLMLVVVRLVVDAIVVVRGLLD